MSLTKETGKRENGVICAFAENSDEKKIKMKRMIPLQAPVLQSPPVFLENKELWGVIFGWELLGSLPITLCFHPAVDLRSHQ